MTINTPTDKSIIRLRLYPKATPSLSCPVDVLIAAGIPVETKFFRVSADAKHQNIIYKPIIFAAEHGCKVCDGGEKP